MNHFDGKWLAAVSGGADSMALLAMCLEKNIDVSAAHVNYHHRPEADEEEAYVRQFCREHGIPVYVRSEPFVYEGNFEAAARTWRYEFFARLVREHGFRGVLIAHQEDDLIETYLMQEEKNLIPAYYGLQEDMMYQGMLVRRPLLDHTAAGLRAYCQEHGIRYYVDATNESDEYARNRIRHTAVAPMGRLERNLVLHEIRQKNAVLQERRCRMQTLIRFDRIGLKEYRSRNQEERDTLLRIFLDKEKDQPLSLAHLRMIDAVLMKKNDFMIPFRKKYIVQDAGYFFLHEEKDTYRDIYETKDDLYQSVHEFYRVEEGIPGLNAVTVSEADFPLTIRSFREGDAIAMRFGTKSVHRFFIDRHIPLYKRKNWPVVENAAGDIILVPGLGCDRTHYSIKPDFNVLQYSS